MNLFLVGWNLTPEERQRASDVLAAMHEAFPLLDASTATSWNGRRGFACWMHHQPGVLGPRRYVQRTDQTLVLYDGVVVEPSGRFAAHDARELASHWDTLTDDLEGHFAAVRLDDGLDTLEIVNDTNGIHPTYFHRQGDRWWIANRVRLLAGAARLSALDLEGVATFVGMYWPGGDRTLVKGATKMPAAQRWRWRGEDPPEMHSYWPVADLAREHRGRFGPPEAAALADAMQAPLRVLSDAFGRLECPITAGHDTRMLTALVMTMGRPADYVTSGPQDSVDSVAGAAIAKRFGLPHRQHGHPQCQPLDVLDKADRRVVQQNDGMISLKYAKNVLDLPERLDGIPVLLYGGGGELTRGRLSSPSFVVHPSISTAIAAALRRFERGGGIQRAEARQLVRDHIERTCRSLLDLGFHVVDVPVAFLMLEHDRRWGALQTFQRSDLHDMFVPFYQRAYVRTAYMLNPAERLLQRVPHHLISHLSPELRAMPSGSEWPPSSLAAYAVSRTWKRSLAGARRVLRRLRRKAGAVPVRTDKPIATLLDQLPHWRERYLDRPDAAAWQVVDRARFEYLTSTRAANAERMKHLEVLYLAATVLNFAEDLESWTSRWC